MIELIQKKVYNNNLHGSLLKIDEMCINMDKEILLKDILRLKEMSKNTKSKQDKLNIKALIVYLDKLIKRLNDDNTLDLCWVLKNDMVNTYPLNLIQEKAYGINLCNAVEISDKEKLVEIDLTSLSDIIAFELMHRDLGITHDMIEEILADCGIIGFESASLLTDYFKENKDNMYQLSKTMRIEETPYYSYDDKKVYDYFNSKLFNDDTYREVVEYSCRYANTIILNKFIKNALQSNIKIKPIMLTGFSIAFIVEVKDDKEIREKVLEDVAIRTFGRQFIIEPSIQIF